MTIQNPLRWSLQRHSCLFLGKGQAMVCRPCPLWSSERPLLVNSRSRSSRRGLAHTSLFTPRSEARPQLIPVTLGLHISCLRPPPPTSSGPKLLLTELTLPTGQNRQQMIIPQDSGACTSGWNAVRRNAIILLPSVAETPVAVRERLVPLSLY